MSHEQDLAEDFSATLLKKHLLSNPHESVEIAVELSRQNAKLRRACRELAESSHRLNINVDNFFTLHEIMIAEYKKTKSARNQITFLYLLTCFLIPIILICKAN